MSDMIIYMNDYDFNQYENKNELNDYEKYIIRKIDNNINEIKEYFFENEEGFHICCNIVVSTIMLSSFGIIF